MGNALLFTACLLGAAVLGGFVGSCCAKGRKAGDCEARVADLEERLDALATHCMDEGKRLRTDISDVDIRADELHDHYMDVKRLLAEQNERLGECELLIGDTPTGGLLGRVGALEEARSREDLLGRANMLTDNVNVLIDDVQELKKGLKGLQKEARGE